MSGEQFLEKYQNRNWIELMNNKEVRKFILSYPNERSKFTISSTIYSFVRKMRETEPDFNISKLLNMDSIDAEETIWSVCMSYIEGNKHRIAGMIKAYVKSLYDNVHKKRRDNERILWDKSKQVPKVKSRETEVPTHEQIYRLVDSTTHLRIQSIFLLSYSSGLKGEGIINLKVKHLRKALEDREKLRQEFKTEMNKVKDPKAKRDLEKLIDNVPLIIKIDARIYPKRFKGSNLADWYRCIISKDAEELLMKYYNKDRASAESEEPLFVTKDNNKFTQIHLSMILKYNIKKYTKSNNGELKNTQPSLLRRSFYNRLISTGMKDIYREYLMGHSLEVKGHYFSWEQQRKDILLAYLKANFNRISNGVTREISSLKMNGISKDKKIQQLEEKLRYFESEQFSKDIINKIKIEGFEISEPSKIPKKVLTKMIQKHGRSSVKKDTT